jgi:nitroreductase
VLSQPAEAPVPVGADAPIMQVMASMRAMRRLRPDPVPRELLETIVRAATWAPSGSDSQHYAFVVVTDRDAMAHLAELWRDVVDTYHTLMGTLVPDLADERHARMGEALRYQAEHFHETPALIAACYQRSRLTKDLARDLKGNLDVMRKLGARRALRLSAAGRLGANLTEASSIYPAVQNLLLAARAHGLGATLTVWHLFREADFRAALGVPKEYGIYALVPVGYPMGRFGPVRRRPTNEVIHWDRW